MLPNPVVPVTAATVDAATDPYTKAETGNRYRKELVNSLDARNAIDASLANREVPYRRGGTTLSLHLLEAQRCSLTQAPDYQASFRANWNWRAS
jgi:hypothetical protein